MRVFGVTYVKVHVNKTWGQLALISYQPDLAGSHVSFKELVVYELKYSRHMSVQKHMGSYKFSSTRLKLWR